MTAKSFPTNKLCPTCGTRLNENATRCLVCGSVISSTAPTKAAKTVQGSRMPEVTLSLPAALGLLLIILAIGAGVVYFLLNQTPKAPVIQPTATATITLTPTVTLTPTISLTPTIAPTLTPLPPVEYIVSADDTCSSIAVTFKIAINAIILENALNSTCTLYVGQKLKIPQPTPTPSPQPTSTLNPEQATEAACQKISYTIAANDTLSTIAATYGVTMDAIRQYNALTTDNLLEGQTLIIPLCARVPTPGPTPTPTPPPPYPAVNLLLPADGSPFNSANNVITLQWASVGSLRANEAYAVTVEDVTEGNNRKEVTYVIDTKYIIPASLSPNSATPHIFRWWVMPVRQVGTDKDGNAIWEPAGAPSAQRVFSWIGANLSPSVTP